jgi:tRNA G37 N-methylase TrmD
MSHCESLIGQSIAKAVTNLNCDNLKRIVLHSQYKHMLDNKRFGGGAHRLVPMWVMIRQLVHVQPQHLFLACRA